MEYPKLNIAENQITLTSSEKKLLLAPQLIEQGTWTAKTGQTVLSNALGGVGNDIIDPIGNAL